jgi:hypothetical protein
MMAAACAALALGTSASGQASGSAATQQAGPAGQEQTGTETKQKAGGAMEGQPGETKTVVGTVEKVEKDKLTLKTGTETQELKIDESTQFTSALPPFSRDQIAEGAEVRASFQGDSKRATEVHVMSKAAPAKPKK